jgi:hypothetical protein
VAESTVEVIVANPARKRRHMAKRMTLKQRLHFGTARQRAAAKASMRGSRKRKSSSRRHRSARKNPGEIIAMTLGNPARKKGGKVAATKKHHRRRRRSTSKHNAGRRRTHHMINRARRRHHNPGHRRRTVRRHHNPAGFSWGDAFGLGAGAVVGSAGSSGLSQLVLGVNNTGAMGYGVNLISTIILAFVGSMGPFKRFRGFAPGILAGGIGSLMRRIIADYSLLGGYSASLGMGDYMVANWVTPQRLTADYRSLTDATVGQGQWGLQAPSAVISSSGIQASSLGMDSNVGY